MSTKAQLETEVADLKSEIEKATAEKDLLRRQIKNLKKARTQVPQPTVDTTCKAQLTVVKQELERTETQLATQKKIALDSKELLNAKEVKLTSFLEMSWFERLLLSKDDLKRLL